MPDKFCKGLFCSTIKKEIQCFKCKNWICKICDIEINKKHYCLDCFITLGIKFYIKDIENLLNKNNESLYINKVVNINEKKTQKT